MLEIIKDKYSYILSCMYHPSIYFFPLDQDGEVERENLIKDLDIYRYGAKEFLMSYKNQMYNVMLINND